MNSIQRLREPQVINGARASVERDLKTGLGTPSNQATLSGKHVIISIGGKNLPEIYF